jgi:hypothetical protein
MVATGARRSVVGIDRNRFRIMLDIGAEIDGDGEAVAHRNVLRSVGGKAV